MTETKALVLVDIQNDFLPAGALAVPNGDQVVRVANRVQRLFDLIVATQDWHPPNHGSFASNHVGRQVGEIIKLGGVDQILWPDHCIENTFGAEFASQLDRNQIAKIFPKGTQPQIDSYSGFFDNDHRQATGLGEFLQQQDVRDVYILGLATDYCVKFTALDARQLGFNTYLIEDGCRGVNLQPDDVSTAIESMRDAGVVIINSSELEK